MSTLFIWKVISFTRTTRNLYINTTRLKICRRLLWAGDYKCGRNPWDRRPLPRPESLKQEGSSWVVFTPQSKVNNPMFCTNGSIVRGDGRTQPRSTSFDGTTSFEGTSPSLDSRRRLVVGHSSVQTGCRDTEPSLGKDRLDTPLVSGRRRPTSDTFQGRLDTV